MPAFDLRLPIGLLFTAIGLVIGAFGVAAPTRAVSLGVNVDLVWGSVLLVLGLSLTVFSYVAGARTRSARPDAVASTLDPPRSGDDLHLAARAPSAPSQPAP